MWGSETPLLTQLLVSPYRDFTRQFFKLWIRFSVPPVGARRPDTPHGADAPHFEANLIH
jgi:hypothetical protein